LAADKAILPNSPIPKIEHLRRLEESADEIGAHTLKAAPHNQTKPISR
jgi:hypothetical protein